jgi:hypothetical protein
MTDPYEKDRGASLDCSLANRLGDSTKRDTVDRTVGMMSRIAHLVGPALRRAAKKRYGFRHCSARCHVTSQRTSHARVRKPHSATSCSRNAR